MRNQGVICILVGTALMVAGCSTNPKRAAITATSAGAGALAGYELSGKKAGGAAIGGVAGAVIGEVAQGRDDDAYNEGVDFGYRQATSDEAKRKFWQQQQVNASAGSGEGKGRTVYYVFDESTTTPDGRKRPEGTEVAVPVYEPDPIR